MLCLIVKPYFNIFVISIIEKMISFYIIIVAIRHLVLNSIANLII